MTTLTQRRGFCKQRLQQGRRMHGGAAREVRDLQSAREPWSDDDGVGVRLTKRGEEPLFADHAGNLVVLLFVAERSRHAATARVEIDDLGAGDALEQVEQRRRADEGALM